jgi:hypothetical protein
LQEMTLLFGANFADKGEQGSTCAC